MLSGCHVTYEMPRLGKVVDMCDLWRYLDQFHAVVSLGCHNALMLGSTSLLTFHGAAKARFQCASLCIVQYSSCIQSYFGFTVASVYHFGAYLHSLCACNLMVDGEWPACNSHSLYHSILHSPQTHCAVTHTLLHKRHKNSHACWFVTCVRPFVGHQL
jgi:hypothetical protein